MLQLALSRVVILVHELLMLMALVELSLLQENGKIGASKTQPRPNSQFHQVIFLNNLFRHKLRTVEIPLQQTSKKLEKMPSTAPLKQ